MNRTWSCLFAATTLVLTACGDPVTGDGADESISAESSALKNGTLPDGTAKWRGAVKMQIYSPILQAYQTCSGQVVSRESIVTAGHCVAAALGADQAGYVTVIINRETSSGQWLTVLSKTSAFARRHPNWDGSAFHDVGVVKASTPFTNVASTDAMPLALSAPSGQTMWALGYGGYDLGLDDGQGRAGQIAPTYSNTAHEYTFAATATQPWLCNGDSGGPIKMFSGASWRAYGFASWFNQGTPGATCGGYGHWATTFDNSDFLEFAIGYYRCVHGPAAITCW